MTVGQELAAARLQLGLSLEELSACLGVGMARLIALENTDVRHLPSRIYLRDLVRAYATEVGLDADELTARYVAGVDAMAPAPEDPPLSDALDGIAGFESPVLQDVEEAPQSVPRALSIFIEEADLNRRTAHPPPAAVEMYLDVLHELRPVTPPERVEEALPLELPGDAVHSTPPVLPGRRTYRFVPLAAAALFTFVTAYVLSVYPGRDDRRRPHAEAGERAQALERAATPANDAEVPGAAEPAPDPLTGSSGHAAAAPEEMRASETVPASGPVVAADDAAAAAADVTGQWNLTSRVESASYSAYKDLTLSFHLTLQQQGSTVVGHGYKSAENGKALWARRRTPIDVEGSIEGRRLLLNFQERGATRTSAGRLLLEVAEDGSLRGRFNSDAARSSGTSLATRAGG